MYNDLFPPVGHPLHGGGLVRESDTQNDFFLRSSSYNKSPRNIRNMVIPVRF